jgi:hypothetical protein
MNFVGNEIIVPALKMQNSVAISLRKCYNISFLSSNASIKESLNAYFNLYLNASISVLFNT